MKVPVHDIEDATSFVTNIVVRRFTRTGDKDELIAEGLVILFELAQRYDPSKDMPSSKPGHVCRTARCCVPSFAGYASFQLPLKLLDAWHGLHPEHVRVTVEGGGRKYVHLQPATGLEHDGGTYVNDGDAYKRYSALYDKDTTRFVGDFIPVPEAV